MSPRSALCISLVLLLGFAAAAICAPLDPPSASVISADRSSITLQVQAGPSGAPAGFVVEWLPADRYDALGGWPADGAGVQSCTFYGVPTLNVAPDTGTFQLDPGAVAVVVIGRLFDETGVSSASREELPEGTAYVVRVRASAAPGQEASPPSLTLDCGTKPPASDDCTLTQGYWKNHPESWSGISYLKLGWVAYNQAQLLVIFGQPARGNGLVSLAHQLIAAKLNLKLGVTPPTEVAAAIQAADALIGSLVVPPIGSGTLSPSATAGLTDVLDSFNSGNLGPGHCRDGHQIPVLRSTWGSLKAAYR